MATILITGGAGFIGSHLVDRLVQSPKNNIVVIDNLVSGAKENIHRDALFYNMDIVDNEVAQVFKEHKPDFVYHIAAQIDVRKSVESPLFDAQTNIMGSLNILELCRQYSVKKVLFASTGGAIYSPVELPAHEESLEDPLSPYAINKFAIDKYLHFYYRTWGLKYVSLRFANVYGPRQDPHGDAGVIAIFIKRFLENKSPTKFGSGKQTRDYIFINDIVELALKAMSSKEVGVFNAGTSRETSLNELIDSIIQVGGFDNIDILQEKKRKGEVLRSVLDCRKSMQAFNWKPHYSLSEGLAETIEWFKRQHDIG